MAQLPTAADDWLASHYGIIDRPTLRPLGLSDDRVDQLLRTGRLLRVHRGVYRSAHWPTTLLGSCLAASLAVPGAAVSHRWAAAVWGFRRCGELDLTSVVDLAVARPSNPRPPGIRVHRSVGLPPTDVVTRSDGIRLTSPVRTVCDLGRVLSDDDLESVIEQVLNEFGLQFATVERAADRLARRGYRGGARVRRVLAARPDGARPVGSHLELRVVRALRRAGLPAAVRQHPIRLANGQMIHADLAFPDVGLLIEIDHRRWHSGDQMDADKARDRLLAIGGYHSVRVTDRDLRDRFASTIAQLAEIHRVRSHAAATILVPKSG